LKEISTGLPVEKETYAFGSFRLMPTQRTLLDGGRPLHLGSRALDILVMLVERAGATVPKDELITRVWPDTTVDDASLRVHIAALRKALGDGRSGNRFIANVPGRGYAFVASAVREQTQPLVVPPRRQVPGNDIPASLTRIIGRDGVIASLAEQLRRRRLLTIVGAGGIGKTTVAIAVAETVRGSFADGVWFVALASLPNPDLVPSALGGVLGIPLPGANPVAGLVAWLRDKQALIVLDNCEHVVGAAATLAEEIVRSAPRVSVLATSREPLRAEGEWRHRLAPLEFPRDAINLAASDALRYPALQLFSERATAAADDYTIDDGDIPALVEICRRLDGVPLALELVAAHIGVLGVKNLAARLDDRFALLIQGRRTALPRHQTLRATLDWSYALLPAPEQVILRRLAVFRGDFTMQAARAVAADAALTPDDVVHGIANLVDKSLLVADIGSNITYYRLLEMTRGYTLRVLHDSGEREHVTLLHADYYRELLAHAGVGAAARTKVEWAADYGRQIDNVRVALDWALSDDGNSALGVALAAAASDFWIGMSLLSECCDWGLKAVAQLGAAAGTRDELLLQCSLGQALTFSRGMQSDAKVALTRAVALAESLGDPAYQVRATYVLWQYSLRHVDFRDCLALAGQCTVLAETMSDPAAIAIADFAFGQARYYLGEHIAAAANLERTRAIYPVAMRGGDRIRFSADVPACTLSYQAVAYWSLGLADRAARAAREAVAEARSVNDPVALCISLCGPNSIVLLNMGYLDEAERCIEELIDHSEKHSLTPYHAFGLCAKGRLMAARGNPAEAQRLLRRGIQRSRDVAYYLFDAYFQGELAASLGDAGRIDEGLVEIDSALRYAEQSESLWCIPEILRIKGELLAGRDGATADGVEALFMRSRDLAHGQGALSWELRAAMSLARFWRGRGRADEARALLDGVYGGFTEGFDTTDLRSARSLLERLS
jgi:predicted ATPase/DNA-binding winged helix-turn-helix (wHTH) protein